MPEVIQISTNNQTYNINIGNLYGLNALSNSYSKILIVTNPHICALHINKILSCLDSKNIFICTIKDGEQYKNLSSIEYILENAFIHKLDRKSLIIAFGGGVISDMSGFAASIYQRGIDFISIPTTLLSQVDASVGGKTGVNNSFGKNLIGTFYQPKAVYIDTDFLDTLPKREFSAGISEIIKIAVCFDRDFFDWLENVNLVDSKKDLQYAICRSVALKADIVSKDEKENDIRAGLNYGHTFGHIIELLGNYSLYLHGESVGMGMCKANNLAVLLGMLECKDSIRISNLLKKYHIPTEYKIADLDDFYHRLFLDKKSQNSNLRFVIPNGIGDMKIITNPPKELLFEAMSR